MKLTKRNGMYYLDWRDPMGKRRRVSTGTRDKEEAERRAQEILTGGGTSGGEWTLAMALDHALEFVWNDHKSFRTFYNNAKLIKEEIGHLRLNEVTYDRLKQWARMKRRQDLKPATINRRLSNIRRALVEAVREGKLAAVPEIPRQVEDNKRLRWLNDEEERELLRACDVALPNNEAEHMQYVIEFLIDTGARANELLRLRSEHVNAQSVRFEGTKSRAGTYKARTVPLTPRAARAVRAMLPRLDTNTFWTYDQMFKRFRKVTSVAELNDINMHTLRHTCASRLVQRGADIYRVKDWLGHSNVTVTERYAHLQEGSMDDMAQLLDSCGSSTGGHSASNVTPFPRRNVK